MSDFEVRTADQLSTLLRGFRRKARLSQADVALRMGVSQQTISALEQRANQVSAERLFTLLNVLGVEVVLRDGGGSPATLPSDSTKPAW
ncbi:MAG TPA: helix-turn-helix transcriptional regulator [Rhodocyclaceae bacterium]|nr:helix-turn-helix transcriptional regulator [Rhodocyclaceae bacterium]